MNTYLNFEQACDYLKMSKSCLYKLTFKKEIKHFKPGGKKIYFKKSDLDDWISKGKVPTSEEVRLQFEFSSGNSKGIEND